MAPSEGTVILILFMVDFSCDKYFFPVWISHFHKFYIQFFWNGFIFDKKIKSPHFKENGIYTYINVKGIIFAYFLIYLY